MSVFWSGTKTETPQDRNVRWTRDTSILISLLGFVYLLLYSLAATSFLDFVRMAATLFILAGAAFGVGALTGFLFGIPRTQQEQASGNSATDNKQSESENKTTEVRDRRYQVNTNLEQVSDWLTKILVGIGLTQFSSLHEKFVGVVNSIASGLPVPKSEALLGGLFVYFLLCGFLSSYLITRLFLAGAFSAADAVLDDLNNVKSQISAEAEKISDLFSVAMAPNMYLNLKKLASGEFGPFEKGVGLERELYHLRNIGFIEVGSVKAIPYTDSNLSDYVRVTPTGMKFVELRERDLARKALPEGS